MARKRRRSAKYKANSQVSNNRKVITISEITSHKMTVPDYSPISKRKTKTLSEAFVDAGCIQNQVSQVWKISLPKVKPKEAHKRRKGCFVTGEPFVPNSCITNSITPVMQFAAKEKIPVIPNPIFYGPTGAKGRRTGKYDIGQFVPSDCVTNSVALAYQPAPPVLADQSPKFIVYPQCASPVPDIISGTNQPKKPKVKSWSFVATSCITNEVSVPYQKFKKTDKIKYIYVDRPNSPDIVGPVYKKTKRKPNNVISFVTKSCTIEVEENVPRESSAAVALARTAPETALETKKSSWLPLVALIAVLLAVIGYITQR